MIPDLLAASFLISRVYFWISGFFSNLWTLWLCTFEPSKIKANSVRTDRYRSHHLSSLGETKMNVWRMKSLRLHLGSPTNLFSGSYLNVKSQTCQRLFRSRVLSFEYLHDKNENLFLIKLNQWACRCARSGLTSGMKGVCSMPASSRLKLMERKMGWALTSVAPPPRQPSLSVGSLASSWGVKNTAEL